MQYIEETARRLGPELQNGHKQVFLDSLDALVSALTPAPQGGACKDHRSIVSALVKTLSRNGSYAVVKADVPYCHIAPLGKGQLGEGEIDVFAFSIETTPIYHYFEVKGSQSRDCQRKVRNQLARWMSYMQRAHSIEPRRLCGHHVRPEGHRLAIATVAWESLIAP